MYNIYASEVGFSSKKNNIYLSSTKEIKLRDSIYFYDGELECLKPMQINGDIEKSGFFLNFTLQGKYAFKMQKQDTQAIACNRTIITNFNHFHGTSIIFNEAKHRNLGIYIRYSFLQEHFPAIYEKLGNKDFSLLKNSPTSPKTLFCLREILNNQHQGEFSKIYLESKTLEILTYELEGLFRDKRADISLDEYDKNAINTAKEILLNEYANPPSILNLAKRVKINDFKLKKAFKLLFGKTPYEIVREKRLLEAKKMLESSDYNISEISNLIGIKNQGYFSRLFFQRFKILPKDLMKCRKYYI